MCPFLIQLWFHPHTNSSSNDIHPAQEVDPKKSWRLPRQLPDTLENRQRSVFIEANALWGSHNDHGTVYSDFQSSLATVYFLYGHGNDSPSEPFCLSMSHLNFSDLKRICTFHSLPLQRKLRQDFSPSLKKNPCLCLTKVELMLSILQ